MAARSILVCLALFALVQGATAKKAPRVRAQKHAEEIWAQQAMRRSLLQMEDAAAAPATAAAPTGLPLPTPENALEVCSYAELRKATKCPDNKKSYYDGEGPDEECCKLLSEYYSNASTKPTRNCWCDPDVWAREQELELKTYILLGTFFDGCSAGNWTVGDEAINYYQDGAGPCAGMPAAAAGAAAEEESELETPAYPPKRSFGKWFREGLRDNPFVAFSFAVSIPSVVGFSIMMWPFLFHAVLTIVELPSKMAAKKAM